MLFIGSPRTGSTLLGQLINFHPQCLIANESRFLTNVVSRGVTNEEAVDRIIDQATKQFESGLENDSYFGKTIDRYQPRWLPFADLAAQPEFRKRQPIAVI